MKRIILTGGGTAGHVTPNIALIPKLKVRGFDIHYVGQTSGIEKHLMTQTGIPYHGIAAGKLRRYMDRENIKDVFRVAQGCIQSLMLVRRLHPQIVFSKGGYVSCPFVWAAWVQRVPVIIHESDLTPGLANKLSAPFATRICFSFPETAAFLPTRKSTQTGIPIRESLFLGNPEQGRVLCGFTEAKPIVSVMGGSQGAESLNQLIRAGLHELLERFQVCHLCGQGKIYPDLTDLPGYKQVEYADEELPHLLAMADVVVSRAGATTIFELLALKKPNVLVPLSRRASRGDQILNARSFEKRGFSSVILEEHLSISALLEGITTTYAHRPTIIAAMNSANAIQGVNNVVAVIEKYAHAAL